MMSLEIPIFLYLFLLQNRKVPFSHVDVGVVLEIMNMMFQMVVWDRFKTETTLG
jgi:hypothetical protein